MGIHLRSHGRFIGVFLLSVMVVTSVSDSNPPVFSFLPTSFKIFENQTAPLIINEATATQTDGNTLTYTMTSTPPGSPFTIDSATGKIAVPAKPAFDFETTKQYVLAVTVKDVNSTITDTLTVNIQDVNEKPACKNFPGTVHIPEDTIQTYTIYNALGTDPENDPLIFRLYAPNNVPFTVEQSGRVKLNTNPGLDFETRSLFKLVIEVMDHELYSLCTLEVTIDDVNEPPHILNMGNTLTLPRITLGPIYYVQAVDEDLIENLKYTFTSIPASNFGDPFVLNPATGELTVQSPTGLDPSVTNLYTLNITVMDKEGLTDSGILTIKIVDITAVPNIWNLPLTVFVKETETVGLKIFHARTVDMINGTLVYNITISPDEPRFRLSVHDGEVWYKDHPGFDFETTPAYDITMTVTNGAKVSAPKTLHVIIKDMNEPPVIHNLHATVSLQEDVIHSAAIFKVTATDQDIGSVVTFSMTSEPKSGESKFHIDPLSGEVRVVDNPGLDYETVKLYSLWVTASDGEKNSRTRRLRLEIKDVNEPPRFPSPIHTVTVAETESVGYVLPWNCTALDADRRDKVTYSLKPTPNSDYFRLDTSTGCKVTLAKPFHSENPSSPDTVALFITAKDKAGSQAAVSLMVKINNVNDHSPVFDPDTYLIHVIENQPVDTPVFTIQANDTDTGMAGQVRYNLTNQGHLYFDIDYDGELTIGAPIDREEVSMLVFNVVATDMGSPPLSGTATVTAVILEENDNRPQFLQAFYNFETRYDSTKGTIVGAVSALDTDKPEKILEYSLLGVSHDFGIVSVSGVLQTKQILLPNIRYLLYAQARDTTIPQETSEAVGTRIDTYECVDVVVRMDVYRQPSFFDQTGRFRFTSAMIGLFPGFVARIDSVKAGETEGTSAVLVYLLRNNSTASAESIYQQKEFVPVAEVLTWTTYGEAGSPVAYLSSHEFTNFPVTKVSCECCPIIDENWWLDTTPGRVTTGILATIGAALAMAGVSWLGAAAVSKFRERNVKPPTNRFAKKNPFSYSKPQYKEGSEMKWWKLQPKAAFDEPSALEEKYRPPSQESQTSEASGIKQSDVRAELTSSEQPPDRTLPPAIRPKPAKGSGLEF